MLAAGNRLYKPVWGPWSTVGFGLIIGIVFLLIQALVVGIFLIANISFPISNILPILEGLGSNGLLIAISTITTTIVCLGIIIGVIKLKGGISIVEYLSLRPLTGKTLLIILAITVVFIILSDFISFILGKSFNTKFMLDAYRTSHWVALFWVAVIIFAPAFEETFFRGFLFTGLIKSKIGVAGTIILTALGWASLHLQYDYYGIVTVFLLGILLGIVRYKTNSLWNTLIMHAFVNLIGMIEIVINVNGLIN